MSVRAATVAKPDDHVIVIFGATGDLAKRKILPGLFHLFAAGLLPNGLRVVGAAPKAFAMSTEEFRIHACDAVGEFCRAKPVDRELDDFTSLLSFGVADPDDASGLVSAVEAAERELGGQPRRLHHLAVPPAAFPAVIELLGATGLNTDAKVICEKPFGHDLASAEALNATIAARFDESQVFRIDHFLGKESVDNILALRFANGLFEPIWNRQHVSYVQIDVPESISIEGRAAFYETNGAFRDMVVTHLFQLMGIVAMEPPTSLNARPLRDETVKVFESMPPLDPKAVVRGQYDGYRKEPGVDPESQTETFVALRTGVDNWRWKGVPFYLRTGKCLGEARQVVTIGLREPAMRIFPLEAEAHAQPGNRIVIDFADPGAIHVDFLAKRPGPRMRIGKVRMTFDYANSFMEEHNLEAYEHLLLEAMHGNQALFTRSDGIERLWEISAPLLESPPDVEPYWRGSWGPESISRLIAPHRWYLPE
ncbi:MAG TPA: glucose-6-phosphate dehydrogenase [Acidimicrobiales bacterium]|nr:glucose-6-phosphate dehydrogenase [Acidimicrobiales bacterium]